MPRNRDNRRNGSSGPGVPAHAQRLQREALRPVTRQVLPRRLNSYTPVSTWSRRQRNQFRIPQVVSHFLPDLTSLSIPQRNLKDSRGSHESRPPWPRCAQLAVERESQLNVFDLDRVLICDYERFARSFTRIRAPDIRAQVEAIYASRRFWPEPLISINPHFERGDIIAELVADGTLHPDTAPRLPRRRQPDPLHRHQAQAIAKAPARQSFVVTTGTGSGKSLCFFVPIIDAAIRARAAGETRAHARDRRLSDERAGQQPDQGARQVPRAIRVAGPAAADLRPLYRAGKPGGARAHPRRPSPTSCSPTS